MLYWWGDSVNNYIGSGSDGCLGLEQALLSSHPVIVDDCLQQGLRAERTMPRQYSIISTRKATYQSVGLQYSSG